MNTCLILLSCAGVLIVILNQLIGEGIRRVHIERGGKDIGVWPFRAPLILFGVLLTCLSFLAE